MIYGAPGIGPYRMPAGLRYAAIRFAIRPTARNAERFDRFALLDLDATRDLDPGWFEAFDAYTRSRATVRHVKRTMRRLIGTETEQIPDDELRRITGTDHPAVGSPRPHGPVASSPSAHPQPCGGHCT